MLIFTKLLLITLGVSIVAVNCENEVLSWSHELLLDKGLTLKWTRDDPVWLVMEMSAPTTGYVSIGFSPNGGMKDSDIVMGWVDENGKGFIQDLHAAGNQRPLVDTEQNYELLKSTESENGTTLQFRRMWNTCDDEHDFIIGDDTIRLIWAYNSQDPVYVDDLFKPAYHGELRGVRRSYVKIPAQHASFPDPQKNPTVKHWDIQIQNNTVNAEDDVYFCTIVKFVDLEKKHHMIGFQPILVEENKYNIHHMIMYECIVPSGETAGVFEQHVGGPGGRCYTPNMPPTWGQYCINIPVLWTSGSEGTMFPDFVGFNLGEKHGGTTYFMFEIHYDNPQLKTFQDNSGLRIFYTDELREYDGGVMAVGHKISPFQTVPPLMSSFTSMGYCTSECTAQALPPNGITAITVLLHAHLAGRKIELKHLRNWKELPTIAKDGRYDYNYQQARVLQSPRQILPGDELITICEYDTTNRKTPAFGGLGTRDEMCMAFVYYYPKIQLADCKSQPEFNSFLNALGINRVEGDILKEIRMPYVPTENQEKEYGDNPFYLKNSTYDNPLVAFDAMNVVETEPPSVPPIFQTVGDVIRNLTWADPIGKMIENKWLNGKHYAFCTGPNQKRYPLENYIVSMPKYEKFVEQTIDSCLPRAVSGKLGR